MLEVKLFGTFELRCRGKIVPLSSRLAQSLFAYLILNAGTASRRERLAGLFWPESTEERARASLRHELWRIRKAVACGSTRDVLISDDLTVTFDPSTEYSLDVKDLTQIGDDATASDLFRGLNAYQGELLPGFYDDWVVLEREHLELVFEKRLSQLLRLLEKEKRWTEIVEWAERWLSLSQSPEQAYRSLMIAYAALGDRSKLLATYRRCAQALEDLGLEPSEEIRTLADLRSPTINLPAPLTSFVGRQRELRDIASLLDAKRLVTLTGSGGVGKTRLSIEVASAVASRFPDGVWYLQLASVQEASSVPRMLQTLLRIPATADEKRSIADLIQGFLGSRRALIILDNCEHLIDACAQLASSLLNSCAGVHILATSREALRVAGELPYRVTPLALPASDDMGKLEALAKVDSVKLFVERANARSATFALTPENARFVAEMCVRLDGIPLALELAAGRINTLNVESMVHHLNERFALLTGGLRSEIPRHQTLRALIDWSHDLLSDPERVLFRRLSVFAGGWTLEAAREIVAYGALRAADVLRLLPELVEKSLVLVDGAGGRYDMLETVREYAVERLKQDSDEVEVRTRHLDYWLALVQKSNLDVAQDEASFAFLAADHHNLLAAMRWCDVADRGAQLGMELMGATRLYWRLLGQYDLAYQLTRHVLNLPGGEARNLARQRALYTLGQIGLFLGLSEAATEALEESLAIAREISDPRGVAESLHELGNAFARLGNDRSAVRCFEEALRLARELDYGLLSGIVLNDWAECLRASGDLEAAESLYEQSLPFKRQAKNPYAIAIGLLNVVQVSVARGRLPRAKERLLEALALISESRFPTRPAQFAVETCGAFMAAAKDWPRAARLYGASEAQRERMGEVRDRADEQLIVPLMAEVREMLGEPEYLRLSAEGSQLSLAAALSEARARLCSDT